MRGVAARGGRRCGALGSCVLACLALVSGCESERGAPRGGASRTPLPPASVPALRTTPSELAPDGGAMDRASTLCRRACDLERRCDLDHGNDPGVADLAAESHRLCSEQCDLEDQMPRGELDGVSERRAACLPKPCAELEACLAALRRL